LQITLKKEILKEIKKADMGEKIDFFNRATLGVWATLLKKLASDNAIA